MTKGKMAVFVLLASLCVLVYACKPGCRDPKALNYNSKASSDDGSCLYCDTTTSSFTISTLGADRTLGSPFVNTDVALAIVSQRARGLNGNGCKTYSTQFTPYCSTTLSIVNLTNRHMTGKCLISFFENGFGVTNWTSVSYFNAIPAQDTVYVGQINSFCDTLSNGFIEVSLDSMQYF